MAPTRQWAAPLALLLACAPAAAQQVAPHATVVYAVGAEPTLPVPVLAANDEANIDVSDQLFLHLVTFAPGGNVTGDHALLPSLARSWRRIDPLTLVFEIDPRARWQDGVPVTAHDVIYTWRLITNPRLGGDQSRFESVASVDSVGPRDVRVRFKRPSPEQVYVFGFLVQPVPAHLLEHMSPDAIGASNFVAHPIGDGPFRFERRVPGQFVELRADSTFFLGKPTIYRIIFRYVEDPAARLNLFLTGETDVLDNIPLPALAQIRNDPDARLVDVASNNLLYFLFNTRSPSDTSKPNPLFDDIQVRRALALALDRST
ncbi:MAG: ABC transporter substrate-binding protein, partial [Gemmatimonadales bacterium]